MKKKAEQLETVFMKEKEMTRCISDLELHLEAANYEAGCQKTSNLELISKTTHSISIDEANEEVASFLKYEYPNYYMGARS